MRSSHNANFSAFEQLSAPQAMSGCWSVKYVGSIEITVSQFLYPRKNRIDDWSPIRIQKSAILTFQISQVRVAYDCCFARCVAHEKRLYGRICGEY